MNIDTITSIAMDLAGRNTSFQGQDETSNLIFYLLDKGYNIYLFSSNQNDNLDEETFVHSRVHFVKKPVFATDAEGNAYPEMASETTFWVTDDRPLQSWLAEKQIPFAYTVGKGTFGDIGFKIGSMADLCGLFDASGRVLEQIGKAINSLREAKGPVPFVIGVGGAPLSGFEQFGIDLRGQLGDLGHPLVDIVDLTPFLITSDTSNSSDSGTSRGADPGPWMDPAAGSWVVETVLSPLRAGRRVFVESLPPGIPEIFDAHLPLFLSEESLVVVLGQTLFHPALLEYLDFSILLEISGREATRRAYEIPQSQDFEEHFVTQYMEREGAAYGLYLSTHSVEKSVSARVNAERAEALSLSYLAGTG